MSDNLNKDNKPYEYFLAAGFNNFAVNFEVKSDNLNNTIINLYEHKGNEDNPKLLSSYAVKGGYNNAIDIVWDSSNHLHSVEREYVLRGNVKIMDENKVKEYLSEKVERSNKELDTAQKAGYVQGVCESVLAFNTDENRKIMSEATITFLSKKLLSEMNVTKDMAQKFAHPETYKALEKCLFTQKQEQQLEQTQSQGMKI